MLKQLSCIVYKGAAIKSLGEKSCEIKGSSHAMMLMIINLIIALCIIIAATTDFTTTLFSPRLLNAAPYLAVFA